MSVSGLEGGSKKDGSKRDRSAKDTSKKSGSKIAPPANRLEARVSGPGYQPGMKMNDYLTGILKLVEEGEYEAALERHLWFHDHVLEIEPAMYGVRLSFALSDWQDLAGVYPPALTAMKKVRNAKTALLKKGKGTRALFHDVEAINQQLQEDEKTADLFRSLEERDPEQAKSCWDIMKDVAMRTGDIPLARKYMVEFQAEFEALRKDCEENLERMAKKDPTLKKIFLESFAAEASFLIKVAQASGLQDLAVELQKRALKIAPMPSASSPRSK